MNTVQFELKAEYEWRTVLLWHVVPVGTSAALCQTPLAPSAETRPITDIDALPRGDLCVRCSAGYLGDRPSQRVTAREPLR